jgi:drug/metabolite transporter (DMT)-like permease
MAAELDERTGRVLGIALVSCSAAVFGLAGVLTKSIHADPLTINCWRGLVGGLMIAAYVFWRRSREANPPPLVLGWRGWLMAVVGAAASIAFIAAFKNTYVANVAIIYATAPFVAALLGWLLVREKVRSQTMLAAAVSLAGVGLMVFSGIGTGRPFGDGLAMVMTFGSALYMVLIRKFRDTPVVWAGAVSAFLLFVLGWFVTDPLAVTVRDAVLLAAFGASFALASVLWTEGSRLIPAAEAGLLGAAEVPFAILFGWLFLAEFPPLASVIGGTVVLFAVFAHAGRDLALARAASAESKKIAVAKKI